MEERDFCAVSRQIRVQDPTIRVQFAPKNEAAGYTLPFFRFGGVFFGVDQSTAFGVTLRKTEYPGESRAGLGIPSCVVFLTLTSTA